MIFRNGQHLTSNESRRGTASKCLLLDLRNLCHQGVHFGRFVVIWFELLYLALIKKLTAPCRVALLNVDWLYTLSNRRKGSWLTWLKVSTAERFALIANA
jgi:hypothetical protein